MKKTREQTSVTKQSDKMFCFALFALLLTLVAIVYIGGWVSDSWLLFNSGRYVLQNGIPYTEPFTVNTGCDFVLQQWLTSVIYWVVYDSFGTMGVLTFCSIIFFLIIISIYKLCILITHKNKFVSLISTTACAMFLVLFIKTNPRIFDYLLIPILMIFLELYIKTGKKRYLTVPPLISVLEVNLHASMWPLLPIILIPYLIDAFEFRLGHIRGQGYKKKSLLTCFVIVLVCGFLNPYGLDAMLYLANSYNSELMNTGIGELSPLSVGTLLGKIYIFFTAIVIFAYWINRYGSIRFRYLLLTLGMFYMGLSSIRNLPLFVIVACVGLAYYYKDSLRIMPDDTMPFHVRPAVSITVIMTAAIMVFLLIFTAATSPHEAAEYDVAEYLNGLVGDTQHSNVRIYTSINSGYYFEYEEYKCYIDARPEIFFEQNNHTKDIFAEYWNMTTGQSDYRLLLSNYDFDYIIVDDSYDVILKACLPSNKDYICIYDNSGYQIYKPTTGTL